jgi:malate dehydrogenase (oxaloacetate-decarboxylating)
MTDKMIVAGAKRLAELAPALKDPDQALLPDFGGESTTVDPGQHEITPRERHEIQYGLRNIWSMCMTRMARGDGAR